MGYFYFMRAAFLKYWAFLIKFSFLRIKYKFNKINITKKLKLIVENYKYYKNYKKIALAAPSGECGEARNIIIKRYN